MAELFGPVDPLAQQEIVPVHDKVHVAINVIRPNDRHPCLTLFTTGMSDQAMNVPEGQEEHLVRRVGDAPSGDVAATARQGRRRGRALAS